MNKTCICIGHEQAELGDTDFCDMLKMRLKKEIISVIEQGTVDFYTDLKKGTGMWAANMIMELKEQYPDLSLTPILSYPGQIEQMKKKEREEIECILSKCAPAKYVDTEKNTMFNSQELRYYISENIDTIIAIYSQDKYKSSRTGIIVRRANFFGKEIRIIDPYSDKEDIAVQHPVFPNILRDLRMKSGLSQKKLSQAIGFTNYSVVSLLESGKRSQTTDDLIRLSNYFGISVDTLLGIKQELSVPQWLRDSYQKLTVEEKKSLQIGRAHV